MALLDIQNLTVTFRQPDALVQAVRGASFHLDPGESLGIVGESGSGKSVTCLAALRLLREPPARVAADRLDVDGTDMIRADRRVLAGVRGRVAAMVFQDPMSAFDPAFTIGAQIVETIQAHRSVSASEARGEAEALLARVEIRNPKGVCDSYPHQLSGGMLQRSMIAMALSCRPKLLFADEPTTALDVTVQAQILQLIKELQAEFAMALVMVTHDLGVIAETTDRVVVMYGGQVMETAGVTALFDTPRHPYAAALLASIPGQAPGKRRLTEIPGAAPNPAHPAPGCPFHARCPEADARCAAEPPPMVAGAACWRLA
jgi:oligopeptide/dipeptide ABC transporter ATP-binding protein